MNKLMSALFFGTALICTAGAAETFTSAFGEGNKLYRAKNYKEAVKFLDKAEKLSKTDEEKHAAISMHAACLEYQKDLEGAIKVQQRYLKIGKKQAYISGDNFSIGTRYRKLKKHEDAMKCFQTAVKTAPKPNWDAYYYLAVTYQDLKRYDDALATYKEYSKLPQCPNYYKQLATLGEGQIYLSQKKFKEAFPLFRQLYLDKTTPNWMCGASAEYAFRCLMNLNDAAQAEKCYQEYMKICAERKQKPSADSILCAKYFVMETYYNAKDYKKAAALSAELAAAKTNMAWLTKRAKDINQRCKNK